MTDLARRRDVLPSNLGDGITHSASRRATFNWPRTKVIKPLDGSVAAGFGLLIVMLFIARLLSIAAGGYT